MIGIENNNDIERKDMQTYLSDVLAPVQAPGNNANIRRVTPQPSPSQLAMEERGLERVLPRLFTMNSGSSLTVDRFAFAQSQHQYTPIDHDKPLPPEPENESGQTNMQERSRMKRNSSVYSRASSCSIDSKASLGDTIEQIIELYSGLASEWSDDDDVTTSAVDPDLPMLQPQAYRDTIAPLLRRRYSFERSVSSLNLLPKIPTTPMYLMPLKMGDEEKILGSSCHEDLNDEKQATSFQEFKRGILDIRRDTVSPMSISDMNFRARVDDVSALNTPQLRMDSFEHDQVLNPQPLTELDSPGTSPLSSRADPDQDELVSRRSSTEKAHVPEQTEMLGRPGPTIRIPSPRVPIAVRQIRRPREDIKASAANPIQSERYYDRPSSIESDSTDSFVMYSGITDAIKGKLKTRIRKRKESKDRKEVMKIAAHKYPGMAPPQLDHGFSLIEARRASIEGANSVIRRLSLVGLADDSVNHVDEGVKPQMAIPLTEYQKYGAQIWSAEAKEKRREERRRQKMSQDSQYSQYSRNGSRSNDHMRTGSQQSTKAVSSPRGEQWGMMRGLKMGLGRSASQKRRDKLKASIVVIGPTSIKGSMDG